MGGDERGKGGEGAEAGGAAPSVALLTSSGDQIRPPDVTFRYKEGEDAPSLGGAWLLDRRKRRNSTFCLAVSLLERATRDRWKNRPGQSPYAENTACSPVEIKVGSFKGPRDGGQEHREDITTLENKEQALRTQSDTLVTSSTVCPRGMHVETRKNFFFLFFLLEG